MDRASGGSNMPHWIRNNILNVLRAMSVKIAVEYGTCFLSKRAITLLILKSIIR